MSVTIHADGNWDVGWKLASHSLPSHSPFPSPWLTGHLTAHQSFSTSSSHMTVEWWHDTQGDLRRRLRSLSLSFSQRFVMQGKEKAACIISPCFLSSEFERGKELFLCWRRLLRYISFEEYWTDETLERRQETWQQTHWHDWLMSSLSSNYAAGATANIFFSSSTDTSGHQT